MKKSIASLVILSILSLSLPACHSENSINGVEVPCTGILDEKNPQYKYEADARNIIIGLVFSASALVPGWVVLKRLWCPVSEIAPNATATTTEKVEELSPMDLSEDATETEELN